MADPDWKVFSLAELISKQGEMQSPYFEFLRAPTLSCGIYTLDAGSTDLQAPHDEDEVYYVIGGRGKLRVDGVDREVQAGSICHVRATAEHSFFEIEEDMTLLVFFASGGPSSA